MPLARETLATGRAGWPTGSGTDLLTALQSGESPVAVDGGNRAHLAYLLATLYRQLQRPLLVICAEEQAAQRLLQDLTFFLGQASPQEQAEAGLFPCAGVPPYVPLSPPLEVSSQRLGVLVRLQQGHPLLVLSSPEALWQRLLPPPVLARHSLGLHVGHPLNRDRFVDALPPMGYRLTEQVGALGEVAVRGGIVDLFPPLYAQPLRIEWFGDRIASLRPFEPDSQHSLQRIQEATIYPLHELILEADPLGRGLKGLREMARARGASQRRAEQWCERFSRLEIPSGGEQLLPLFYPALATLFDYLAPEALLVLDDPEAIGKRGRQWQALIDQGFSQSLQERALVCEPAALYTNEEEWQTRLGGYQQLHLYTVPAAMGEGGRSPCLSRSVASYGGRMASFTADLRAWVQRGYRVALVVSGERQALSLQRHLQEEGLGSEVHRRWGNDGECPGNAGIAIVLGSLSMGFELPSRQLACLSGSEIFGRQRRQHPAKPSRSAGDLFDLERLRPGDCLVHLNHGIGRYVGMRELLVNGYGGGYRGEFLEIEYAEGEKLYVPVEHLHLIQRYLSAEGIAPRLDKLGSNSWERTKKAVKESVREMAQELLQLYASRQVVQGQAYSSDGPWHQEFAEAFEYDETPDQVQAITEVCHDLEEPQPMDRLICGDVGYGKTEVALRAAFKAVMDGRQVAVLVPTTVLAQQHLQTFRQRFSPYPVCVEVLSRFRTPREQEAIIRRLQQGEIDIIIGTHRLLQADVSFKDLGLLVIDEEQRFGVLHKERLKQLRQTVHVLTLTATPIPRTLHLSLMGVRDLSIIQTPPEERLAIQTFVAPFGERVIRQAICRELERGGQIYFVHNRVESIQAMGRYLNRIVPQARLAVAHGQMSERALEEVMLRFVDRQYDLLLCSAIIESGLDIPAVNTILINRADRFGLAQLYQLRGRVGRDRFQAYAYLLIPGADVISETAKHRLRAVMELTELGSGLQLAMRDLETRGAGHILGVQQSGHMGAVGFELYCQLMRQAIAELKGEAPVQEEIDPKIALPLHGHLPSDFVPPTNQRLAIYKRLMELTDLEGLAAIQEELLDRYGQLPDPVLNLLLLVELRILAKHLRILRIEQQGSWITVSFDPSTPLDPARVKRLVQWAQEEEGKIRLTPEHGLQIHSQGGGEEDCAHLIPRLGELLAGGKG